MEKEQEAEEDRREEETEAGTDIEMEQQAGDKEEARGRLNWEKLMELMSSMKKDNKELLSSMKAVSYTHLCIVLTKIS